MLKRFFNLLDNILKNQHHLLHLRPTARAAQGAADGRMAARTAQGCGGRHTVARGEAHGPRAPRWAWAQKAGRRRAVAASAEPSAVAAGHKGRRRGV